MHNIEDRQQLVCSSGSIGAISIEANESISQKDFHRGIKICRKEAKETNWVRLLHVDGDTKLAKERTLLENEAQGLMMIFGSILIKTLVRKEYASAI